MSETVLTLDGVSKSYGDIHALERVSLCITEGEFVAIVGASGSGKSTLLNIMGTLDRPTTGSVTISGVPTSDLADADISALRAHRIGFVFQQSHLADTLTAIQNVSAGLLYAGVPRGKRRAFASAALDRVGLSHRHAHRPYQLSGGERQRVGIARALVNEPALVLADEPTGALDSANSASIMELFHRLNSEGTTIAVITHETTIAAQLRRRISLSDGRIVADTGTP